MDIFEEIAVQLIPQLLDKSWNDIAINNQLTPQQKAVFFFYFGIGLSPKEVCDALDILPSIVDKRIEEIYSIFDVDLNTSNKYIILIDKIVCKLQEYEKIDIVRDCNGEKTVESKSKKFDSKSVRNSTYSYCIALVNQFKCILNSTFEKIQNVLVLYFSYYPRLYQLPRTEDNRSFICLDYDRDCSTNDQVLSYSQYCKDLLLKERERWNNYLDNQLENRYIPEQTSIELFKRLMLTKVDSEINFDSFTFKSQQKLLRLKKQYLVHAGRFVKDNQIYFCDHFFPLVEHQCVQLGINWNAVAPKVWDSYLCDGVTQVIAKRTIEPTSWLRYFSFSQICQKSRYGRSQDLLLLFQRRKFQNCEIQTRILFEEHIIELILKRLSDEVHSCSKNNLNWHKLWIYAQSLNACVLSNDEAKQVEDILFQATSDRDLDYAISFIEQEFITKLNTENKSKKLKSYLQNWCNLKEAFDKTSQPKLQFNIEDYAEYQKNNSFAYCTNFDAFRLNIDDQKHLILKNLSDLESNNVTFNQFKQIVEKIPFADWAKQHCDNFKFDSQQVHISHYVKHRIKFSIACWSLNQEISLHKHACKYDAIYLYQGSLEQTQYINNKSIVRTIKQGEIVYLDYFAEHQLKNSSCSRNAISVHLQRYEHPLSQDDIHKEYLDSKNHIVQLTT